MAMPDRDSVYNADGSRKTVYQAESGSSAGWVIGGIIVVALIVIAYFVFAGHSTDPTDVYDVEHRRDYTTTPAADAAPGDNTPAPRHQRRRDGGRQRRRPRASDNTAAPATGQRHSHRSGDTARLRHAGPSTSHAGCPGHGSVVSARSI